MVTTTQRVPQMNAARAEDSGKSCLIRIYPAGIQEGLIDLPRDRYVIGRGSECNLELPDSAVSRQHACIEFEDNQYHLVDLGSTNGTYVNDKLVRKRQLVSGDFIRIGTHIMKFLSSDHIETQYHETIYAMMITDGLTGVHNKRYFLEALEREIVRSHRHRRPLSLAILDIDSFKKLNDSYGHLAGDAVLREMCNRIKTTIRKDEVFARYGGEEFVVVLPEASHRDAMGVAERLRSLVADIPFVIDSVQIQVTISIGIAQTCGGEDIDSATLIARADQKLYEAKRSGRNRVVG